MDGSSVVSRTRKKSARVNRRTDGLTDRRINWPTDGQIDERPDYVDFFTFQQKNAGVDHRTDRPSIRLPVGPSVVLNEPIKRAGVDRRIDGRTDGWIDRRMGGPAVVLCS